MAKKNKILVVAESIDVEDSSGSKANVALIKNLHKAGYLVKVYHYSRKEIELEDIKCYSIQEKKINLFYLLSRLQRKIQNNFKLNLAQHLEKYFGFSFTFFNDTKSIICALRNIDFSPHLVITLSKGASFRPHMALLKMPELHDKWLAYIHDPYPFHFYPLPYKYSEPGYEKKIQFFENVFEKARWLAFPSLLLQNWMFTHYKNYEHKSLIIPHQILNNKISDSLKSNFLDKSKFSLLHAGNLMAGRPPQGLLIGFQNFLLENPMARENSQLIFIGQNSYYKNVLEGFKMKMDQIFVSEGYVEFDEVQYLQRMVTVNVIIESVAEISPFLPGKFPHCVVTGQAILLLGPSRSEARRLLGEDYRYYSELDDDIKIKNRITELYQLWKHSPDSLKLNRPHLEQYLSYGHLKKEIDNILGENKNKVIPRIKSSY